uniref:Uncharacterized protein n=1 Tax=Branchiostoma floridae TaxID=7739 RepID=C3Y1B1_BRAFL|eukprot:XP_002609641.1 hypothetical protein BRAFLDRAFT_83629 [Branchiostoma floridae]
MQLPPSNISPDTARGVTVIGSDFDEEPETQQADTNVHLQSVAIGTAVLSCCRYWFSKSIDPGETVVQRGQPYQEKPRGPCAPPPRRRQRTSGNKYVNAMRLASLMKSNTGCQGFGICMTRGFLCIALCFESRQAGKLMKRYAFRHINNKYISLGRIRVSKAVDPPAVTSVSRLVSADPREKRARFHRSDLHIQDLLEKSLATLASKIFGPLVKAVNVVVALGTHESSPIKPGPIILGAALRESCGSRGCGSHLPAPAAAGTAAPLRRADRGASAARVSSIPAVCALEFAGMKHEAVDGTMSVYIPPGRGDRGVRIAGRAGILTALTRGAQEDGRIYPAGALSVPNVGSAESLNYKHR